MIRDRDQDAFDRFQPRDRGRFGDNELADSIRGNDSVRSNLVDVNLLLRAQTPKAICVAKTPDGTETWLPKSQVEFVQHGGRDEIEVTLPKWLAKDKGLI